MAKNAFDIIKERRDLNNSVIDETQQMANNKPIVYEIEGQKIEFDSEPTEDEIDEVAGQLSNQSFSDNPDFQGGAMAPDLQKSEIERIQAQENAKWPNVIMDSLSQTGRDVTPAIDAFVNQALYNAPRSIVNKMGGEYPKVREDAPMAAKGLYYGSGIAGAILSPINKLLGLTGITKAPTIGKAILEGAKSGAKAGAIYSPEDFTDIGARAKQAAGNAILGGVVGGVGKSGENIINVFKNIKKYSKPQNQVNLAEEVRNGAIETKQNLMEKYGEKYIENIKNSDKEISIGKVMKNFFDDYGDDILQNDELNQSLLRKDQSAIRLKNLLDKFTAGNFDENISVQEADKLNKFIKELPGIKSKLNQIYKKGYGQVDFTNNERMLLDLANDLKSEVINVHPELSSLNKEYGTTMNDLKLIRKIMGKGQTIDKLKNFSKIDPEITMALERTIPKNTVNKIKDFNQADKLYNILKAMGLTASVGAVGGGVVAGVRAATK